MHAPTRQTVLRCLSMVLLGVYCTCNSQAAQTVDFKSVYARLSSTRDYLYPSDLHSNDKSSRWHAHAQTPEPPDGSTVAYTAFNGTPYSLIQYNGAHVAFLIQPQSLALNRYSNAQLRGFIDHLDILFDHFKEIMHGEPSGPTPLLHIAFVNTCGGGCGYVGSRGIELAPEMLDPAHTEYPDGSPYVYAIHEMTHNFDQYSGFIMYGPDIAHAWTDFMNIYISVYNDEGQQNEYPDAFLRDNIAKFWSPYLTFPNHTWDTCVRQNACNSAAGMEQHSQGGMLLRLAQMHGPAAVKAFVVNLQSAVTQTHPSTTADEATKNDLLLQSFANGANADVSCYVDTWNWTISQSLRAQLGSAYGANGNCTDHDGDGYSVAQGDADDTRATVYPGAPEIVDGLDNDQDGYVDDVPVTSTASPTPQAVPFPSAISGALISASRSDNYQITLPTASHVRFQLESLDTFQGWVFLNNQSGQGWFQYAYTGAGSSTMMDVDLAAGVWTFNVAFNNNSAAGKYKLLVVPFQPWPTGLTAPPPTSQIAGIEHLTAPPLPSGVLVTPGLTARFWVQDIGWVGSAPVAADGSAAFTWVQVPGVVHCALTYRVQFVSGGLPVSATSQPESFSQAGACTEPVAFYNLVLATSPAAGGSILPNPQSQSGQYPQDSTVCLTAVPTAAFRLSGWTGDALNSSGCLLMTTNHSVSAQFVDTAASPLNFVPMTPCRVADTRQRTGAFSAPGFGSPSLSGGTLRSFDIPASGCNVPANASAYSLNVTVVPQGYLGYITLWPSGQPQPIASTLNSFDGRTKANAAIVPAGDQGAVTVIASDPTNLILDINGYFIPAGSAPSLDYYPLTPCRFLDTRKLGSDFGLGPLLGGQLRDYPLQQSACNIPPTAQAYSLNITAVPNGALGYITVWPFGQAKPGVSTLNAPTGAVTANAAIVPAGTGGDIGVYASDNTDLVIDVTGYFDPAANGGLSFYVTTPCRVIDTRKPGLSAVNGPATVNVLQSACATANSAQAFVFNATVVPTGGLGYLSLWPDGQARPVVSTLNALDGAVTSNMAIVTTSNGSIDAFGSSTTHLILDLSGYFAP